MFLLPQKSVKNQKGFALVISLSLMAFMLLLVLSLSTLVQVESRSASISRDHLVARLNSQLGAMIALGDLQRYTGPDQRVTARADILLNPITGQRGPAGQERWTGVWSSKASMSDPFDVADGLSERKPKWLVSGQDPDAYTKQAGTVVLASIGGSVIDKSAIQKDDTVTAANVEIRGADDGLKGHYAYWVSDEGVKARVNIEDRHLGSSDRDVDYYRTAMAQQADPTAVSNIEGKQLLAEEDSPWKKASLDPSKIISVKNVPMFLKDALPSTDLDNWDREFFHDFTAHSRGVLANTKNGGLKRDLSTALLTLPDDLKGPIFEPFGSSPSTGDPGGPKWEQLSDYYQFALSATNSTALELRIPTTEQVGIAPVVTRWNLPFFGFADYNGIGDEWTTGAYDYSIGLFPLITLWNPYNKDLALPEIGVEFDFIASMDVWSISFRNMKEFGHIRELLATIKVAQWRGGSTSRNVIMFRIKPVTIPAGQAYNFSPPNNSIFDHRQSQEGKNNVLVPGGWSGIEGNMNGFFTEPISPSLGVGSGEFLENAIALKADGGRLAWPHKFRPAFPHISRGQGGNMWRPVLNLYDLSVDNTFNTDGSNRFKSLTVQGLGQEVGAGETQSTYKGGAYNPRVIRLNRINKLDSQFSDSPRFNTFLQPLGSSVQTSYLDPGNNIAVNLYETNDHRLAQMQMGISSALKFPDMPYDDEEEIPIHLYRNFSPTAPVVQWPINAEMDYDVSNKATMYTRGAEDDFYRPTIDNYTPGTDGLNAKLGSMAGINSTSGSNEASLYDISTPLSIGHLMHANLFNYYGSSNNLEISNGILKDNYKQHTNVNQALYSIPAYAIGNSFPDLHIPLNKSKIDPLENNYTSQSNVSVRWCHYDYSYELNSALWDGYFFSGIDPSSDIDFPLPDARLVDSGYTGGASLRNEKQAAARLMQDGAFNANSTSVAAWESVLGAMREIENSSGGKASSSDQLHNFSRFSQPIKNSTSTLPSLSGDVDSISAGFRSLSDSQITDLAEAIVTEIRLRSSTADMNDKMHPYTSVSDFINRSLDISTPSFAYSGVLQAAIDKSGINGRASNGAGDRGSGLWVEENLDYYPLYAESNLAAERRPRTDGMPGSLTQADLLNKIGHILQVRSDTFVIRSRGDVVSSISNGTNQPSSQAYYEIVVQRTPEHIDSTELAYDSATSDKNKRFGRKYRIVSESWLSAEDI